MSDWRKWCLIRGSGHRPVEHKQAIAGRARGWWCDETAQEGTVNARIGCSYVETRQRLHNMFCLSAWHQSSGQECFSIGPHAIHVL